VLQTTLTSWSLAYDVLLAWLFWHISSHLQEQPKQIARALVYLWILLLCRIVKYLEHFVRYPSDLKYVLLIPLFGYFHASFIKLHAMFTLHVTTWGSRAGADANDSFRMIELPSYRTAKNTSSSSPSRTVEDQSDDLQDKDEIDIDIIDAGSSSDSDPLLPRYSVDDD